MYGWADGVSPSDIENSKLAGAVCTILAKNLRRAGRCNLLPEQAGGRNPQTRDDQYYRSSLHWHAGRKMSGFPIRPVPGCGAVTGLAYVLTTENMAVSAVPSINIASVMT